MEKLCDKEAIAFSGIQPQISTSTNTTPLTLENTRNFMAQKEVLIYQCTPNWGSLWV